MLKFNEEYFGSNYYFLLREKKDAGHLWFSVAETISEARKNDEYIKVPKEKIETLKKHLEKIVKSKKKKTLILKVFESYFKNQINCDSRISN